MDGAALQHKVPGVIAVQPQSLADGPGGGVVLLPVGVKAVEAAAPGVELPVDAPDLSPVIHDAGGADVPGPGVVGWDFQNVNLLVRCKSGPGLGQRLRPGQHPDFFAVGDGPGDLHKGALRLGAAPGPGTRPDRPDHDAAPVRLVLRRHPEALCGGAGGKYLHGVLLLRRSPGGLQPQSISVIVVVPPPGRCRPRRYDGTSAPPPGPWPPDGAP